MEAMKRRTVLAALIVLGLVLPAHGTARTTDNPLEPEKSRSSRESTFSDPIGKDSLGETGFDMRDDIARGQEFLKDKIAGSLVPSRREE